jgi:hypothetical protein
VGDRIDIQGVLGEFNGMSQVASSINNTSTTAGAPLGPMVVTVSNLVGAEAAAYESCRVEIQTVSTVSMGTGVGFSQSGAQIRASNFIWAGSAFPTAGMSFASVRGFSGIYQSARELLPQVDADLTP